MLTKASTAAAEGPKASTTEARTRGRAGPGTRFGGLFGDLWRPEGRVVTQEQQGAPPAASLPEQMDRRPSLSLHVPFHGSDERAQRQKILRQAKWIAQVSTILTSPHVDYPARTAGAEQTRTRTPEYKPSRTFVEACELLQQHTARERSSRNEPAALLAAWIWCDLEHNVPRLLQAGVADAFLDLLLGCTWRTIRPGVWYNASRLQAASEPLRRRVAQQCDDSSSQRLQACLRRVAKASRPPFYRPLDLPHNEMKPLREL